MSVLDNGRTRGVAPLLAVVVLIALVVLLASLVGVAAVGFTDAVRDPPPRAVFASADDLAAHGSADGGIVGVRHLGGETIAVERIALVVDATDACEKRGRLHGLPLGAGNDIESDQIAGDDVFDQQSVRRFGTAPHVTLRDQWRPSETITVRIPRSDCPLEPGDRVAVAVIDERSNSRLARLSFVVE